MIYIGERSQFRSLGEGQVDFLFAKIPAVFRQKAAHAGDGVVHYLTLGNRCMQAILVRGISTSQRAVPLSM
jgi:hypothetical protein